MSVMALARLSSWWSIMLAWPGLWAGRAMKRLSSLENWTGSDWERVASAMSFISLSLIHCISYTWVKTVRLGGKGSPSISCTSNN